VANYREVLWAVVHSDSAVIFAEVDIKHPVEAVFDAPMTSNSPCERGHVRRQTTDKVSTFGGSFAILRAPALDDYKAL